MQARSPSPQSRLSKSPTSSGAPDEPTSSGPTQTEEERTCRLCFAAGDDEDGKLIAPCKCSGTLRYIHRGCLNSWRKADRKNAFYRCGQCGERYRFRSSGVARVLANPAAPFALTLVILLAIGSTFGTVVEPLLRFTEKDPLQMNGRLAYSLIHHRAVGDGLREFSSALGFLAGDCRFASTREPRWTMTNDTSDSNDGSFVALLNLEQRSLTWCGEVWHAAADEQAVARPLVAFLLHCASGIAVFGLAEALFGNLQRMYIGANITVRVLRPRWIPEPGVPYVYFLPPLFSAFVIDLLSWTRRNLKQARRDNHLFAPSQIAAILATAVAAGFAGQVAWVVAKWLVKQALSHVEDLVVDLDAEGTEGKKTK